MKTIDDYLAMSTHTPSISYAGKVANSERTTHELIKEYFKRHSKSYLEELNQLEKLNNTNMPDERKLFVYVVGFNEERNIPNLIDQYKSQLDDGLKIENFEVIYVINYPDDESPSEINSINGQRFQKGLQTLMDLQKTMPNLHIVPKAFPKSLAGLSRARKYGMDYALFRMLRQDPESIDTNVLISNEGDTLEIPQKYLERYILHFAKIEVPIFVQGNVEYPDSIIRENPLFRTYAVAREQTHINLGIFYDAFPSFGGMMPIGRNYAASPRICVLAGGIDPTSRKEADDDMTFGWDVTNSIGKERKYFFPNPIITNPRRELGIIKSIIENNPETLFNAYVNFHDNQELYDQTIDETLLLHEQTKLHKGKDAQESILNQFFSWVVRESYKKAFLRDEKIRRITQSFNEHEIGYFQKETALSKTINQILSGMPANERETIEKASVEHAQTWFTYFTRELDLDYKVNHDNLKSTVRII